MAANVGFASARSRCHSGRYTPFASTPLPLCPAPPSASPPGPQGTSVWGVWGSTRPFRSCAATLLKTAGWTLPPVGPPWVTREGPNHHASSSSYLQARVSVAPFQSRPPRPPRPPQCARCRSTRRRSTTSPSTSGSPGASWSSTSSVAWLATPSLGWNKNTYLFCVCFDFLFSPLIFIFILQFPVCFRDSFRPPGWTYHPGLIQHLPATSAFPFFPPCYPPLPPIRPF